MDYISVAMMPSNQLKILYQWFGCFDVTRVLIKDYKKDGSKEKSNYRPFSILSNVSKVY